MASAKSYMMARRATNYRYLSTDPKVQPAHAFTEFELDESDVWGGSTQSKSAEFFPPPSSRPSRKSAAVATRICSGGEAASVPVNIPDWSKILRGEYRDKWSMAGSLGDVEGGDDGGEEWVPPHEYLARTRKASFSVQEGIGRTLKGRDLSRVRNAIWEKTGFQD